MCKSKNRSLITIEFEQITYKMFKFRFYIKKSDINNYFIDQLLTIRCYGSKKEYIEYLENIYDIDYESSYFDIIINIFDFDVINNRLERIKNILDYINLPYA